MPAKKKIPKVYLDFETRSHCDLRTRGAHIYSEDKTTDILAVGFMFEDMKKPEVVGAWQYVQLERLMKFAESGGRIVAHNAPFEFLIWNNVGVKKYGWQPLTLEQMDCTMARAYAMALPGSLDGASSAVGIKAKKDAAGHRLMMKMSQPAVYTRGKSGPEWHETPEQLERLFEYCAQDIVVTRELDSRLLALSPSEKEIWILDQKINNYGVQCDTKAVDLCIKLVEVEQKRLDEAMREATNNRVATTRAHIQMKAWIQEQVPLLDVEGVAKDDVLHLLDYPLLPPVARQALQIRQEAAKSSTKKLQAMAFRSDYRGRMRGLFQYHGSSTGRWAGRAIQPQNFPRPTLEQEQIEFLFDEVIHKANSVDELRENILMFHDRVLDTISSCLRGFICSRGDRELLTADFNAVEARVIAWLANEERVLKLFREDGEVYKDAAKDIFTVPIESVTKQQRLVGKVAILALGYQGGVGAFQTMARGYNITMAPAFDSIWDAAPQARRDYAVKRWNADGKRAGIEKREWLASELTKLAWREANPNIVAYWTLVEKAAATAMRLPNTPIHLGPDLPSVTFIQRGSFLFCKLPSGRNLCYPYPEMQVKDTPWKEKKKMLTYMAEDSKSHKWVRKTAYGGLLAENITQAIAADLLRNAIKNCVEEKYAVVLHVHDEIAAEVPIGIGRSVEEFNKLVVKLPKWAQGLPLKAEGWMGRRYRKD